MARPVSRPVLGHLRCSRGSAPRRRCAPRSPRRGARVAPRPQGEHDRAEHQGTARRSAPPKTAAKEEKRLGVWRHDADRRLRELRAMDSPPIGLPGRSWRPSPGAEMTISAIAERKGPARRALKAAALTARAPGLRQLGRAELLPFLVVLALVVGPVVPGVARARAGEWTEHGAAGLRAQVLAPALSRGAVPRLHRRAGGASASPTAWRGPCRSWESRTRRRACAPRPADARSVPHGTCPGPSAPARSSALLTPPAV